MHLPKMQLSKMQFEVKCLTDNMFVTISLGHYANYKVQKLKDVTFTHFKKTETSMNIILYF